MKLPPATEQKLPQDSELRKSLENGRSEDILEGHVYLKLDLPAYPDNYFRNSSAPVATKKNFFPRFTKPEIPDAPAEVHDARLIDHMRTRQRLRDPVRVAVERIIQKEISHPGDANYFTLHGVTVGQMVEALSIAGIETASYDVRDADVPRIRTTSSPTARGT